MKKPDKSTFKSLAGSSASQSSSGNGSGSGTANATTGGSQGGSQSQQLMITSANSTVQSHHSALAHQKSLGSNSIAQLTSSSFNQFQSASGQTASLVPDKETPKANAGAAPLNSTLKNFSFSVGINSPANVSSSANLVVATSQNNKFTQNSGNSTIIQQSSSGSGANIITDSHKQIIKQQLMKNAHKPQTKAILEKIMQNRATSIQNKQAAGNNSSSASTINLSNQAAAGVTILDSQLANSSSVSTNLQNIQLSITGQASSSQQLANASSHNLASRVSGFGGVTAGTSQQDNEKVFNSTASSVGSQSNPFHNKQSSIFGKPRAASNDVAAAAQQQNSQVQILGAAIKKKIHHQSAATPANNSNQSSHHVHQQSMTTSSAFMNENSMGSHRSGGTINKSLSRSSSVQKLRDTMYRFTMYHPNGSAPPESATNSQQQSQGGGGMHSHQTSVSNPFVGKIVDTSSNATTTAQMKVVGDSKPINKGGSTSGGNQQVQSISGTESTASTSANTYGPSQKFTKKLPKHVKNNNSKFVLAEKVIQQNALNSKQRSGISSQSVQGIQAQGISMGGTSKGPVDSAQQPPSATSGPPLSFKLNISEQKQTQEELALPIKLITDVPKSKGIISSPIKFDKLSVYSPNKRHIQLAAPSCSSANEEEDFYLNDKDLLDDEGVNQAPMTAEGGQRIGKNESHCSNDRYANDGDEDSNERLNDKSSSDSANSTQDFFYSKKQMSKKAKEKCKIPKGINDKNKLSQNPSNPAYFRPTGTGANLDKLPPNGKAQSSMYMFTFSNNDEEALKRAVQNQQHQHLTGYHYTPTSSSGATTMGQSFSQATNTQPMKKRSIFSENQSLVRALHEETFGLSGSKSRELHILMQVNGNVPHLPITQKLQEEKENGKTPAEKRFKSMYNNYCELRISSPRFRVHTPSSNEVNPNTLSSNRQGTRGTHDASGISNPSAVKEFCDGVIEKSQHLPQSKITYSQMMLQTFAKIPQGVGSQQLNDGYDEEKLAMYSSTDPNFRNLQHQPKFSTLELASTGGKDGFSTISNQQASFTSLPSIKNQACMSESNLTPLNNFNQQRAFSVNYAQTKFGGNFSNSLSPSQTPAELYKNSNNLRPPSSLISKNSGLPQVFLEKYKKNYNFPAGAGSGGHGYPDHYLTQSKQGGFEHSVSPFPHPLESLTLQKRHLSSAECLINRPAFSEGNMGFMRVESQAGWGNSSGTFNHQVLQHNSQVFSSGLGLGVNKASSVNSINPFTQGNGSGYNLRPNNLALEESESLYKSQMMSSIDLRQLQLRKEGSHQSPFTASEDQHILRLNNQESNLSSLTTTPFQKSMPPPKPQCKRIQTQEIRQRKPVISKKLLNKIFSQSPEATRTHSEAGGSYDPSIFHSQQVNSSQQQQQPFTQSLKPNPHEHLQPLSLPQSNHNPLRYQSRLNNESIISNPMSGSFNNRREEYVQYQINIEPPINDGCQHGDQLESHYLAVPAMGGTTKARKSVTFEVDFSGLTNGGTSGYGGASFSHASSNQQQEFDRDHNEQNGYSR